MKITVIASGKYYLGNWRGDTVFLPVALFLGLLLIAAVLVHFLKKNKTHPSKSAVGEPYLPCSRVRGKVLATAYMGETGLLIPKEITIPEVALGDVNCSRVVDNKKYQNHLDPGMTNAFFR